jgi:RNA polymerase sigma factor (sigma-70 family)
MPVLSDDFHNLMQKIRQGSEDAAWQLVTRYGGALRQAVRRVLSARLRPKFDSADFVQIVWLSFFRVPAHRGQFDNPAALVAYLARMAQYKVGMETRRRLASAKYNLNAERSLDGPASAERTGLADPSSAPVNVAIAREQWSLLIEGQPERYRRIIELKLQGHSCKEIADRLQLAECTVRRFLNKLLRKIGT